MPSLKSFLKIACQKHRIFNKKVSNQMFLNKKCPNVQK